MPSGLPPVSRCTAEESAGGTGSPGQAASTACRVSSGESGGSDTSSACDDGVPPGFFDRLNHALALPLKPEWANWLWEQGQQPQSFLVLEPKAEWEQGKRIEKTILTETTQIPITRMSSLGSVACYSVLCSGHYQEAWLAIIRRQLALSIPLNLVGDFGAGGMLLAFGIVCALLEARASGVGQVVDAAMTDGSALLMTMIYQLKAIGAWSNTRALPAARRLPGTRKVW